MIMRHSITALCSAFALLFSVTDCNAGGGQPSFTSKSDPTVLNFAQGITVALPQAGGASTEDKDAMQKGMMEILQLTQFFCNNIYPKPTVVECIDRAKHGIGASADPHSNYFNKKEYSDFSEQSSGTFAGVGLELGRPSRVGSPVLVVNTIEGGPAERAGLLAGDYITHIMSGTLKVPTASLGRMDQVIALLRGDSGTSVSIVVVRKGITTDLPFTLVREMIKVVSVEGELIVFDGKTFAYIKNKQFQQKNAALMEQKFADLKRKAGGKLDGLILSFENNPGGLLDEAYNVIRLFDDSPEDVILTRSNDGIESYVPNGDRVLHRVPRNIAKDLPILVLVNGGSASASEVVAKALKHKQLAVVAGTEDTFGKGIVQTISPGRAGDAIKFTSSEYLIGSVADWVPVQCLGVGLDIKFAYPGVKPRESLTECGLSGHVNSAGPMTNAPAHLSIKEAKPAMYQAAEVMLEAYKAFMLPKMQKQDDLRKELEKE